jgi:glycosyltransferase EpsD
VNKVLFVATVDQHIRHFHLPFLERFQQENYEVHVASSGQECLPHVNYKFDIPFKRNPLKLSNIKAFLELKRLISDKNYDIVHCHTPMGGVITRLASREARKHGTKVIYTAHGFHFYKGASFKKWLLYYPIEKWLAKYTDVLITINNEDYKLAIKKKFGARKIEYVEGIGIDLRKFEAPTIELKGKVRAKYGYNPNDFVLFYAAELSHRKNHELLIKVANKLKGEIPNLKLILAGEGELFEDCLEKSKKLQLDNIIDFLGYRTDIKELILTADMAVSSSRQEGLPVNIMEAMAVGLPVVVTNSRGNRDLVENNENGYVVEIDEVDEFADSILLLYNSGNKRKEMGQSSLKLIKNYSLEKVMDKMSKIYVDGKRSN